MKHALRPFSRGAAPAQPRRAPQAGSVSATIIPLAAASRGGASIASSKAAAASNPPPGRRGSRGGDLIFGGALALILLIACLTWEVLSQARETPHAALDGGTRVFIPAVH